jgi:hypothetical protein
MIKWKALFKASLLLACLPFYLAYKSAYAQDLILADPGLDILIQDEAPLLVAPQPEPILAPTTTYSKENPFATSQYTDIADLAELLIKQGYNVDNYFYSEGFTTGIDGTLGNENVCFRDDTNKVYIGRSDVCVDRQMDETYSYIQIDKMDWTSGFPDLTILQSGDLIGDTSQYWDGCFSINQGWGGLSGGSCPTINDYFGSQINYGYIEKTLTNTAAINLALQEAGVEVTGYRYEWSVKNADANRTDTGNGRNTADPFQVTIKIYDESGYSVYEKTYDYSYWMNWTRFSGEETFEDPFDASTLSELQLSVTGKDLGFWAGYYGPEFREPSIKLNYRTTGAAQDTTAEDALFNSMCTADPLYDPSCPGYNDAMMAQINSSNTLNDIAGSTDLTGTTTASTGTTGTGTTDPVAEATGTPDPTGTTTTDTGTTDPVAEATGTPDSVAEATEAVVEAAAEPAAEEVAAAEPAAAASSAEEKKATGLSATQLNALNAASAVANSAIGGAADAASASASIGLSESGGVSSTLTSVDPTGSTDSSGQQTGSGFDSTGSTGGVDATGSVGFDTAGTGTTGTGDTFESTTGTGFYMGSNQSSMQDSSNNQDFDVSAVEQSVVDQSAEQAEIANNDLNNNVVGSEDTALEVASASISDSLKPTFAPGSPIDELIKEMTTTIIQAAVDDAKEVAEESSEESYADQNAKEDALVEAAQNGSDDEDAQAALLGYNPNFRAYQQEQAYAEKDIYSNQGMYEDQKTYDNPNSRLFNGASDALHREMVRQQYSLGN